ncbi:MAG: OmpH family outer membrane protein [Bacteroidales bacterium]|nr:OmpH family outer membrane protein [Bacteroidales bacterium]
MFKKLLLAVALVLPVSAMAQKFGVVDLESIFTAMPETTEMQAQIEKTTKQYEAESQKLMDEVNNLYVEFQKVANDPNTLESIKERRRQEIEEKYQKVEQFRNNAQQDLMRLQQTLMAPIQTKVTDAVKSVGTEGGYTFIFPNDPGLIMYQGGDVVDVTPAVKTKLGI